LQRFFFARTSLEAQLYPPLEGDILFRLYGEHDFEVCLEVYRKNESGRFPQEHRWKFEEYLKKEKKTLIVAEWQSKVVGYGGINLLAPNVAVLCYGIIDPAFQRQRIGSALTLLRIAQLPLEPSGAFVFIFAVEASMPIYRRFGFVEKRRWKTEDGKDYPLGFLWVPRSSLHRVKSTLNRRGLKIQGNVILHLSGTISCEIQQNADGSYRLQLHPRTEDTSLPHTDETQLNQ